MWICNYSFFFENKRIACWREVDRRNTNSWTFVEPNVVGRTAKWVCLCLLLHSSQPWAMWATRTTSHVLQTRCKCLSHSRENCGNAKFTCSSAPVIATAPTSTIEMQIPRPTVVKIFTFYFNTKLQVYSYIFGDGGLRYFGLTFNS